MEDHNQHGVTIKSQSGGLGAPLCYYVETPNNDYRKWCIYTGSNMEALQRAWQGRMMQHHSRNNKR